MGGEKKSNLINSESSSRVGQLSQEWRREAVVQSQDALATDDVDRRPEIQWRHQLDEKLRTLDGSPF